MPPVVRAGPLQFRGKISEMAGGSSDANDSTMSAAVPQTSGVAKLLPNLLRCVIRFQTRLKKFAGLNGLKCARATAPTAPTAFGSANAGLAIGLLLSIPITGTTLAAFAGQ